MKSSRNKPEAWKLLNYLVSAEAQINFAKVSGMLPARIDAANDPALMRNPHYAEFVAQIKNGRHYQTTPIWASLEPVYVKGFGNMYEIVAGVKGNYSPQAMKRALDATAAEIDAVIADAQ